MQPIEHEFPVKAGVAHAYEAFSTPAGIKAWWAKDSDVGTAVGEPVVLRFNKPDMSAVMKFDGHGRAAGQARRVDVHGELEPDLAGLEAGLGGLACRPGQPRALPARGLQRRRPALRHDRRRLATLPR